MRMMLKVSIPVEHGNRAFNDGSLQKAMEITLEALKPEAAYHLAYEGKRTSLIFFDLADPSLIPSLAEPVFQALGASVDLFPVMTTEELGKGIGAAVEQIKKLK